MGFSGHPVLIWKTISNSSDKVNRRNAWAGGIHGFSYGHISCIRRRLLSCCPRGSPESRPPVPRPDRFIDFTGKWRANVLVSRSGRWANDLRMRDFRRHTNQSWAHLRLVRAPVLQVLQVFWSRGALAPVVTRQALEERDEGVPPPEENAPTRRCVRKGPTTTRPAAQPTFSRITFHDAGGSAAVSMPPST
jgi:hypothetical protein